MSECLVLKAKARLRRSVLRKKEEAFRLTESQSSVVEKANKSAVISGVNLIGINELVSEVG